MGFEVNCAASRWDIGWRFFWWRCVRGRATKCEMAFARSGGVFWKGLAS
jgi:hypothetical protein